MKKIIFAMPRPMLETVKKIPAIIKLLAKNDCFAYFVEHAHILDSYRDLTIIMYVPRKWDVETIAFLQKHWEYENFFFIFPDHETKSNVSPSLIFRPEIDYGEQTVDTINSPFYCILNALHSAIEQKRISRRKPMVLFQPYEITRTAKIFLSALHERTSEDTVSFIVCDPTDIIPNSQTSGIFFLFKDTEDTGNLKLNNLLDFVSSQTTISNTKVFHESPQLGIIAEAINTLTF